MHVVTVTFEVKAEHQVEFLREMRLNAQKSLEREPGCSYFDVCVSSDGRTVFLYELYADRGAFDLHLASEHFQSFNATTAGWVASKEVKEFIR